MLKIPKPEKLVGIAQSTKRNVVDRKWIKYQRYIAKHEKVHGKQSTKQVISFEKYCAWLRFFEEDMQIPQ